MPLSDSSLRMKRIREIFTEAHEIESETERKRFINEACENEPDIKQEVEWLLNNEKRAGRFFENYVMVPEIELPEELIGRKFDHYRILEHLGEGGFGDVFKVEQEEPIRRQLAMKIIKPGMASRDIIARFERERVALSMMDHPNISRIVDAGKTTDDRPYFVMDLACGVPITRYCDDNQLPLISRLKLFLPVCWAVQHAHQKGVLHRDLNPSNILVVEKEGNPVPVVIDFGIAKLFEKDSDSKTMGTGDGVMMGTPVYMSPEQMKFSSDYIDTRSDIYSLGVILYELLTGLQVFDPETIGKASLAEIQRIICNEFPDKPSTRVSKSGESIATVCKLRQTDKRTLIRSLKGDLDWIVLKTIDKDRNNRFASVNALSRDIERHINHEPVEAGSSGTLYVARKFARRHAFGVSLTGIMIPVVILGFVSFLMAYSEAKNERDRAELSNFVSQVHEAQALTIRTELLTMMRMTQDPDWYRATASIPGEESAFSPDKSVRQILDNLSGRIGEELSNHLEVEAEVRLVLAESYLNVYLRRDAWNHIKRAIQIYKELYGQTSIQYADALSYYAFSLDRIQEILPTDFRMLHWKDDPLPTAEQKSLALELCKEAFRIYQEHGHLSRRHIVVSQHIAQNVPTDERETYLKDVPLMAGKLFGSQSRNFLTFTNNTVRYYNRFRPSEKIDPLVEKRRDLRDTYGSDPYLLPLKEMPEISRMDFNEAEPAWRKRIQLFEEKVNGQMFLEYEKSLLRLTRILARYNRTDPEIQEKLNKLNFRMALNPGRGIVQYDIHIPEPGKYRLYVRWDGNNSWSDSVYVRLLGVGVADGTGGELADYFGFVRRESPLDADFSTAPEWSNLAGFEALHFGDKPRGSGSFLTKYSHYPESKDVPVEWFIQKPGIYMLYFMEIDRGVAIDSLILQSSELPEPVGLTDFPDPIQREGRYVMENGAIFIEAENFTRRHNGVGANWVSVPSEESPARAFRNYSGDGYIQVLPEPDWLDFDLN